MISCTMAASMNNTGNIHVPGAVCAMVFDGRFVQVLISILDWNLEMLQYFAMLRKYDFLEEENCTNTGYKSVPIIL